MAKIINPNAAGIDIASNVHYVAVSEDKCENPVRSFKGFTRDLHILSKWLVDLGIKTVAMESTGAYWFQLYTILLDYGMEVFLVNAAHVKNVPGRKSDVIDAQWLQELHENGYLTACFQPDNLTRELRTYVRLRKQIIKEMATETQRMQKAMVNMNIKLHDVISDINGRTGRAIVDAIIDGERDPKRLASFRNRRIKCSEENLLKSLEGNWRDEQVFCLKMARDKYVELERHLQKTDQESERIIKLFTNTDIEEKKVKSRPRQNKQPNFNVGQYLYNVHGVDVLEIFGFKQTGALTVLSETGPNLKENFPSLKQFHSWLNLVPNNEISGGKILKSKVRKRKNHAGQAFREAANGLWNSHNPFGDYLRTKKAKSGAGPAVIATAKKIATIYYKMVTEKVEFDPYIIDGNRQVYLQKRAKSLSKTLESINKQLSEIEKLAS
ncbi:IS110 family RNA-guided transposase [Marinilabilia rubra]|uniref:IS110 family transposase n=1 Tax=Marinilabilia rubra TaxID=2162893 RepID=A0A2U2BCL5_9BACT|nr:IS110 family transposase [Marinilabilia rubra]PWE00815.1 IS110 family transposase [Marinilabilia rubra]